jgi:2',3'-cyclic-nucleotide 2'-phosphodiesterase (5'-nucleotidase family)
MRRLTTAAALFTGFVLTIAGSAGARPDVPPGQAKKTTTTIQLLSVSDWHGQLVPLTPFGQPPVGGAAVLKAYFDQFRAENPNTLTFMAGDSWGASPPISSFFEDRPAVDAMNMMGISADTFGNHNFDRGFAHLESQVQRAEFPFVAANLTNLEDHVPSAERWVMFTLEGVDVAVIGIVNEEAPELVTPGSFGTIEITDSIRAANKTAIEARKAGADVVVVLTHKGIRGFNPDGSAFGELIDLANGVAAGQIDVILGDHTDFQYSGVHQDKILVVENRSKGATFADIQLTVDGMGKVVSKSAAFHAPIVAGVTPDADIQAFIDDLNAQLAPILGTVIGESTVAITQTDKCGNAAGRTCESLVGNAATDALRTTYGTDFAITNSGGLRKDLTCPEAGGGDGFCPSFTAPPYLITRGQVLAVLPFGNVTMTGTVSGATIKAFLENGVSRTGAQGRFPQVSGLCFTYDITAPAGSRVTAVVRQAADGTCTGAPVDLTSAASYTLATNDFMAAGGDGYPVVISQMTSRNVMDQDLADYVAASSPLDPSIEGRITCVGAGCPVVLP